MLRLQIQKIESQGSLILIVAREEDTDERWTVQVPFRPYFYVPADERKVADEKGWKVEEGFVGIEGTPLVKVYADGPDEIPRRRKKFSRSFEADVPYTRRFLIDTGIKSGFEVLKFEVTGEHVIIARPEDLRPAEVHTRTRKFLYDIETGQVDGQWSPATKADGPVRAVTFHDTFLPEEGITTFIWHPNLGMKGRVRTELRYRPSEALGREIPWKVQWFGNEVEMLLAWVQTLKDRRPDVLAAWNGHHGFLKKNTGGFDAPYLITRLNHREVGIGAGQMSPFGSAFCGWGKQKKGDKSEKKGLWMCRIDGIQLIDMMTTYSVKDGGFLGQVPYHGLKPVVASKCGIKLKKDPAALDDWWLHDPESYLEYAFRDVDALIALENQEDYTGFAQELQRFSGVEDANVIFRPSTLVGTLEKRTAKRRGVVIPTSNADEEEKEDVEGGYVIKPKVWGRTPYTLVLDLSQMYVAIMQSCNISYETCLGLLEEGKEPPPDAIRVPTDRGIVLFRSDVRGLTPEVLDELKLVRKKYDDEIAKTNDPLEVAALKKARAPAKSLLLTAYGHMLSRFNPLFNVLCGSAVTGAGRTILHHIEETIPKKRGRLARGDTDSGFALPPDDVKTKEQALEYGLWLQDELGRSFDDLARDVFNVHSHNFEIGLETIFDPMLSGPQMKMYAGRVIWTEGNWVEKPEVIIKGLQGIKGSAAPITEEATWAVIRALVNGVDDRTLIDYVRGLYESVAEGNVPLGEVVQSVSLNFDVETDESSSTVLAGAQYGRETFDFKYPVGSKVRVVAIKSVKSKWLSVPEGEDIPTDVVVDWEHHANATVLAPLRSVFEWVDLGDTVASIRHGSKPTKQNQLSFAKAG